MTIPLHMLLVEDSPDDAQLIMLQLEQAGLDVDYRRVDTEAAFIAALDTIPNVILSDYALPRFDGLRALRLLAKRGLDIPFILISGTMGEEIAVEAIKHGADDYLMKDRLGRLGPAIQHALEQKRLRDEKAHADEALRQSQQAYQSLVNTVDGIVWAADANTFEFQFVSQQAERLLGYPIERWMNEPTFWKDHIHPDDQTWAVNYDATLLHSRTSRKNCPPATTRMLRSKTMVAA
jgi:CheY-like chemotaxis protein